MTKADLVNKLIEKIGLSQKEAYAIVEIIIGTVMGTLVDGQQVKIARFGTFTVKLKKSRRGRNPKTGEDLEITPRRVVTFKASGMMKETIEKTTVKVRK